MKILAFLALFPLFAHAGDSLVLDPAQVACKLEKPRGFPQANVYYAGILIHQGRETSAALAGGDFVLCQSVVDQAKSSGQSIVMNRGYAGDTDIFDWGTDGFFTVSGN